jgi:hypothetical protein
MFQLRAVIIPAACSTAGRHLTVGSVDIRLHQGCPSTADDKGKAYIRLPTLNL